MSTETFVVPRGLRHLPLSPLFDPHGLRHLLASTSICPAGVREARVHYVRIKDDGRVVLGICGEDLEGTAILLSAVLDEPDRLRETARQASAARRCVLWPDPLVLIRGFEDDPKLTALARVTDKNWLRRRLQAGSKLVDERWRVRRRKSEIHWMRYKPERRAVGRLELSLTDDVRQEKSARTLYVRCRRRGNEAVAQWVMQSAHEARLVAPMPLATLGHGISIESKVEGRPVERSESLVTVVGQAGGWLARLHGLVPCPVQGDALRFLRHRHAHLAAELGRLDAAAGRWADELVRRLASQAPVDSQLRQLHGDFHHGQLLAGENGIGVVDFDRVCLGDPSFDLAVFRAHLVEDFPELTELMYRALLNGYEDVAPLPPEPVRAWFECAVMLAEAGAGFRRADVDWNLRLHRKLEMVDARSHPARRARG